MKSIPILTCLCIIDAPLVYGGGVPRNVGLFLYFLRGEWDNKAQAERPGSKFDFIQSKIQPVNVSLFSDPVVYIEEYANGQPRLIQLGVVTDNIDGNVDMKLYTFTNLTEYKSKGYNVENLSKVTHDDIHSDDDCVASFIVREHSMSGSFPQCAYTVNGTHPRFAASFSCDEEIVTVPLNIQQTTSVEPYVLRRTKRMSFPVQ